MKTNKKFKSVSIVFGAFAVLCSIVAAIAAILVVSPIDPLPDIIPYFIGYIDDILIGIGGLLTKVLGLVSTGWAIYFAIRGKKVQSVCA